jgi:hypothetical protein
MRRARWLVVRRQHGPGIHDFRGRRGLPLAGSPPKPQSASTASEPDLTGLRNCYLAGELGLEEFEGQVADTLEGRPTEPTQHTEHWEIHVHNAPPGSHLHIHLP